LPGVDGEQVIAIVGKALVPQRRAAAHANPQARWGRARPDRARSARSEGRQGGARARRRGRLVAWQRRRRI